MKSPLVALFLLAAPVLLSAGPTAADRALVDRYKDTVFSIEKRNPRQIDGDWKLYELNGGISVWVDSDGYTVVQTPEQVTIEITFEKGKEYDRSFSLPSGRTCTVSADKSIEWGVVKEPAPDFTLSVLGGTGQKVRLSDLRGKVIVLDFWASWCQPCMHALPDTQALYKKYAARGLKVFGVNIEGDADRAAQAAQSLGLSFPILLSEPDAQGDYDFSSAQMTAYRIHAIPALFLIDKRGVVQKSGELTAADIDKYLNE